MATAYLNQLAGEIIDEIWACTSEQQVRAVSEKYGSQFGEIQQGAPVRAIHIVNAASLKRKLFQYDAWKEQDKDLFK